MSYWDREKIRKGREETFEERFKDADREALKQYILDLETAAYPFATVLSSLDEKSWRGTNATSKLFPHLMKGDKAGKAFIFAVDGVYTDSNDEDAKYKTFADIPEADLHRYEYSERESIYITDGREFHDDLEILAVHQQAIAAYVGCGAITMGDIRHLVPFIFPNLKRKDQ